MRAIQLAVAVVLVVAHTDHASATIPPSIPDEYLAKMPVIVVARWEKQTPITPHRLIKGNAQCEGELHTEIVIERVVRGDIKPGRHKLLINGPVGWEDDGLVIATTSSWVPGDVDDVFSPNLWFVEMGHSWDRNTYKDEILALSNHRCIQPLELEPYFMALAAADPKVAVPKLLAHEAPAVLHRALTFVAGGWTDWPFMPKAEAAEDDKRQVLVGQATAVERLIEHVNPRVRAHAAVVYASFRAEVSLPRVRLLLNDDDGYVRATAASILIKHKDEESAHRIGNALTGVQNLYVLCRVIDRLAEWRHVATVPGLIAFLQDSRFDTYASLDVPAVRARGALHTITGHWFPFDVKASNKAWTLAKDLDEGPRLELLHQHAGCGTPLRAELIGDIESHQVRVTNSSPSIVKISDRPDRISLNWGGAASWGLRITGMIALKPGDSTTIPVELGEDFLIKDPEDRIVTIEYLPAGNTLSPDMWIGKLEVDFGSDWQEPVRVFRKVRNLWPNGNLKETGTTRNGKKIGEWVYYNEAGDRIRTVDHSGGTTTIHNPEHPKNKGAGRPKKIT